MSVSLRQLKRVLDPDLVRAVDVPHLSARYAETRVKRLLLKAEAAAVGRLAQLWRDAYARAQGTAYQLRDEIGLRDLSADRASRAWADAYLDELGAQVAALSSQANEEVERDMALALLLGYYGRAWGLDVSTVETFSPNMSPLSRDMAREMLRREIGALIDPIEFDEFMLRARRLTARGLTDEMTVDALLRDLRDAMGLPLSVAGYAAGRKVERWGLFARIQTAFRTLFNDAANVGARELFRQNAEAVTRYRWITAQDERVCPDCRAKANTVYNVNDLVRPPLHPNCRCTIMPVIDPALEVAADARPRMDFGAWVDAQGIAAFMGEGV